MLQIQKLNAGYGDLQVLKDITLDLPHGKISILMGPNGAGKSTLIKSVFNITKITGGKIVFNDIDITRLPTHSRLDLGISYVPQGKVNFSILSVEDNLQLGATRLRDKKTKRENMERVFDVFPVLKEKRRQRAFSLSGGQQQMLALGRALMATPKLLMLDEPSLGLSPKLTKEVFKKIRDINQEFGTTIMVVEHNLKSALEIVDYGYVMVNGQIVARDTAAKLKESAIMEKVFVGKLD